MDHSQYLLKVRLLALGRPHIGMVLAVYHVKCLIISIFPARLVKPVKMERFLTSILDNVLLF